MTRTVTAWVIPFAPRFLIASTVTQDRLFFSTTILFSLQYSVSLWSTSVERPDDVRASCILYVSGRTALPSACVVNAICDDWQVKRGNRSALIS